MQLETYISDLLYRYQCVTVPEFGAFLSQRVSATIHETTNAFYPPKKRLLFNEQIKTNDGLLANYIAEAENLSFEEATHKIVTRVKSIKFTLNEGKTVTFKNIGELKLNGESKIEFNPDYNLNYLTDSFGLSQVVSPAVTREILKKEVEAIEAVVPLTITPEKQKQQKEKPYLKYAAIALIALTIGGLVTGNHYVSNINEHNQIAQQEANAQLDTKIQEATFVISNPLPAATLNVSKQTVNYHIVGGAFRVEANCFKKVSQLQEAGFNARKIGVNKYGLHQVAYASFNDRNEALKALETIRLENNKDAWLLVKKVN